jgi:hypothetical protein
MTERAVKAAVVIFVVVMVLLMALAAYGYFSGVWEQAPAAGQIGVHYARQ